jgi:hypothetical protein
MQFARLIQGGTLHLLIRETSSSHLKTWRTYTISQLPLKGLTPSITLRILARSQEAPSMVRVGQIRGGLSTASRLLALILLYLPWKIRSSLQYRWYRPSWTRAILKVLLDWKGLLYRLSKAIIKLKAIIWSRSLINLNMLRDRML